MEMGGRAIANQATTAVVVFALEDEEDTHTGTVESSGQALWLLVDKQLRYGSTHRVPRRIDDFCWEHLYIPSKQYQIVDR